MKRIFDFDYKKLFIDCVNKIKKYMTTNMLFVCFILVCLLLGFSLRIATVGFPIYPKSFLSDLMFSIVVGSLGYLFKSKNVFRYYLVLILFFTFLCIGNTIYYEFYQSYLSINLLSTASMLGAVDDSLFDKLHFYQFLYLLFPIIFIILNSCINKRKSSNYNLNRKKYFFRTLICGGALLLIILTTLTSADTSRFVKQWNREYLVQKYGLYVYTVNDLIQSVQPKINTLFGYDSAAKKFRDYYSCKWDNSKKTNKYTNYFKGKNVIVIHAESIQNFLIDLKINGKEVTPNLNRISKEGMYFNRFYPQISVGTSSDTEFTFNTGLMPSSSGTVFVNYYDRLYYGTPKYFSDLGYYTFSTHANNADYWNRKIMHKNLGYQNFIAKDSFDIPNEDDMEWVGLGLSDKSFFKQLIPKLLEIKQNNKLFYGTVITLSNHSPFKDIDKYGEFDVNMLYTYTDNDGNKVESSASYLEDTNMGNYIKSAHYADEALGQFFSDLESSGLLENTVVILYGDHEARLSKNQFNLLYNYDPLMDSINENKEDYYEINNYSYDLLKNTPLIMWSSEKKYNKVISDVMGMYDVLPTLANMFGFEEKYSLGNDIFSKNEKIVVFPNGNVLTNKVYYSALSDEYITFDNSPIESDYIDKIKKYAEELLEVSNGIVTHDLIKNESEKIGECEHE